MIDLQQLQKEIYQNKVEKGFNTTDVHREICAAMKELGEVVEAHWLQKDNLDEEIADVIIFMLGISEILGINMEEAITRKVAKNKNRKYVTDENGVTTRVRTQDDP